MRMSPASRCGSELGDGLVDDRRRHHQPDRPRLLQLLHEVLRARRRPSPLPWPAPPRPSATCRRRRTGGRLAAAAAPCSRPCGRDRSFRVASLCSFVASGSCRSSPSPSQSLVMLSQQGLPQGWTGLGSALSARDSNDLQLRAPRGSIEGEAKESARTRSAASPRKGCSDVLSAVARGRRSRRRCLVAEGLAGPRARSRVSRQHPCRIISAARALPSPGLPSPSVAAPGRPRAEACRRCAWPTARISGRRVALASRQPAWRLGPRRWGLALASALRPWRSGACAAWLTSGPRPAPAWKHLRPRRHGAGHQPGRGKLSRRCA